ncbi:sugar ABC transporter ATP-binding protein [Streptomyces sp. NPDC048385]|uniref:sugar ABC transporter ATP-binding protein n=1 Tax=unclassified Streptomyces TaxID=2593676 RepID=UPI0034395E6E
MAEPLLSVRGISKSFPGTLALDNVDLTLYGGKITALVGHNGSGKSTLVKILAGIHRPDGGEITSAVADAGGHGLHFIHQDLGLISALTAVENLNLDRNAGWRALSSPNRTAERAEALQLLDGFGVDLDVRTPVRNLSASQRTMIAIARAMSRWGDEQQILVLDEPTATLHDREAEVVLDATRRIAERGAAVLFISHRLAEVCAIADEVVVLRDGRLVANRSRGEFDAHDLVELIAGHDLADEPAPAVQRAVDETHARLEIRDLSGQRLRGVDLDVRGGEIVGVSGVIGSGIEELLGAVYGTRDLRGGGVTVDGNPVKPNSPRDAIAAGMGMVPADRHRHAAFLGFSGRENLTLPSFRGLRRPWGSIGRRRERTEAESWFDRAAVHPGRPERLFAQFSGGNQQKIVLARWMRTDPKVLLLEEPTQGVDVGAQSAIYDLVRQATAAGAAVLVASSDTKELVTLCDRVAVLADGILTTVLAGEQLTEKTLIRHTLATGPADTRTPRAVKESLT